MRNSYKIFLILAFIALCSAGAFYIARNHGALGAETSIFKIFPGEISENTGWSGQEKIFLQELNNDSGFESFSEENSARPSAVKIEDVNNETSGTEIEEEADNVEKTLEQETEDNPKTETKEGAEEETTEEEIGDQEQTEEALEGEEGSLEEKVPENNETPLEENINASEEATNEEVLSEEEVIEEVPEEQTEPEIDEVNENKSEPIIEVDEPNTEPTKDSESAGFISRFFAFIKNGIIKTAGGIKKVFATDTPYFEKRSIAVSDFGLPDIFNETEISNVQLRFSMAASPTEENSEEPDRLLIEYYSKDAWRTIEEIKITDEFSNKTNGGYFLYGLPVFESLDELGKLKIRLSHLQSGSEIVSEIFLESLWLEVEIHSGPKEPESEDKIPSDEEDVVPYDNEQEGLFFGGLHVPSLNELISSEFSFAIDTAPEFRLRYDPQSNLIMRTFRKVFSGREFKIEKINISDAKGKRINAEVYLNYRKDGIWVMRIDRPEKLSPGKYTVSFEIKEGGNIQTDEFEFYWGVLAINTDRSVYSAGESAYIQMAALTETGDTICDANLRLEVVDPTGSVKKVPVISSGECDGNNYTETPDYFSYYDIEISGNYLLYLARLDEDNREIYEIKDSFMAEENVVFDIERIGPTRINPKFHYDKKIIIELGNDFRGNIIETVPESFKITSTTADIVSSTSGYKSLIWDVSSKKGDVLEFSYTIKAPIIFPELYLLGPLSLESEGSVMFQEARLWQIAADGDSQFARPDEDITVGSWTPTPLYGEIDEVQRDDDDFIYSGNQQTSAAEIGLENLNDPGVDTGHTLRYTYRKNASGGFAIDFRISLMQGTTTIASSTHTSIGTSFQQGTLNLTETQAGNITDYTNLSFTLECLRDGTACTGGGLSNRRGVDVSWVELEVPVPVADDPPTVSTYDPVNIGETSATASGTITSDGGGAVTERGFVWGKNSTSTPGNVAPGESGYESNTFQTGSDFPEGPYSLSMSNLDPGTTYYYRAYAKNSEGYGYGNEIEFSTLVALPTVETSNADNIGPNSATGHGEVTSTGGESVNITERGFVWATSSQSLPGNVSPASSTYPDFTNATGTFSTGTFSLSLMGLDSDTTYFYRAYAKNSEGYGYGNEIEFSTLGDLPQVLTLTPDNVGRTSVSGRGNITDIGADNPTERGFVWATSTGSNPGNVSPASSTYPDFTNATGTFSTGIFSLSLISLSPDTTYFYRAYAKNSEGYAYGSEVEFRTLDELPVVTTNTTIDNKTRRVTGRGNVTDDGGLTITERGFVWDTSSKSQPSSSTAPADSDYEFFITATSGSFGTGSFSLDLTQLHFNTTYRYRAYARNSAGYFYGSEVSFTTETAQFSRPNSTDSAGGWTPTPLHTKINSATIDFADIITSDDNTSPDTALVGMSNLNTPSANSGHIIRYTFKKSDSGGHTINFTMRLLHDGTLIESWVHNNTTDEFVYAEQELTETQAGNITDYSLLTVELIRGGDTGGGLDTRRSAQVSWVEFEAPEATEIDPPSVSVSPASNVGMFSAQGNGSVTDDGNLSITSRGFAWATSSQSLPGTTTSPQDSDYTNWVFDTGGPWGEGSFNLTMESLLADTTYYYRAFAENSEGWGWSSGTFGERSFATLTVTPAVTTLTPSPINALDAMGRGNITHLGASTTTERGFVWATSSQSLPGNVAPGSSGYTTSTSELDAGGFETGAYELNLESLEPETQYFYRAYAKNDDGYAYGGEVSFTTKSPLPEVTTLTPPNPVGPTTATGTANLTFLGASNVTERGFVWATSSQSLPGNVTPGSSGYTTSTSELDAGGFETGVYELQLTGLEELTTYFYRAYAKNNDGYAYGNEVEFTTISELAVVETLTPNNIVSDSADGRGDIKSVGIGGLVERGFVWDTAQHSQPTSSTAPNETPYSNSTSSVNMGGFNTGIYTILLDNLTEGRVYYYRAYVLNDAGYTYGDEVEFNTPSDRPTVTTNSPPTIGLTSATGKGNVVNLGASTTTERGFVWSTSTQSFPGGNGDVTPANSGYENNISQSNAGGFGTGSFEMSLTGLQSGTVYYYRSFAKNSSGNTGYNYGNEIGFMTQAAPEITDVILNNEEVIILLGGTTTPVSATANVTDANGFDDLNESSTYAVIYREGVGDNCSANDNNCYITTNCSLTQTGSTSGGLVCTADILYFAEQTLDGDFESETWLAKIVIEDYAENEDVGFDSFGVDLWPVLAIQVIGTIDYGSLEVGESTGSNTEEVVVRNVGNVPMIPEVEGTNMMGQSTIAVSRQKFSSSTFNYEAGGTALSTSTQGLGFVLSKQTSTLPIEGQSFWGISLPTGIGSGIYQGTNTFWAKPQ